MSGIEVPSKSQKIIVKPPSSVSAGGNRTQKIDARPNASVSVVNTGPIGPGGPQGIQGTVGPEGPVGPTGPTGSETTYIHTQTGSSSLWTIQHNLNRYPSIEVVDSAGSLVLGSVRYIDTNQIEVSFVYPFSGRAFLN